MFTYGKALAGLLLIVLAASSSLAAEPSFVTKQVGARALRLPLVGGMIAACDKHADLAARAVMLTPTSHDFVTCMASEYAIAGIRNGVRLEAYPLLTITVVKEHKSGPLTLAEFEQIRSMSQEHLRASMATTDAAQKDLDRQDQAIEAQGGTLKRKNEGMDLGSFFTFTKQTPSFSYVVTRRTTLTEAGASERICEVNFASMLFLEGRMLAVGVIDHCEGSPREARAKALTREWLETFERINSPGAPARR